MLGPWGLRALNGDLDALTNTDRILVCPSRYGLELK